MTSRRTFFGLPLPGCSTIIMVLALSVAGLAFYTGFKQVALSERGIAVEGVVVSGREYTDKNESKKAIGEGTWLDVAYPDQDGRTLTKQFFSGALHHRIGDKLSVTYLPDKPSDAILGPVPKSSSSDNFLAAGIAAAVGLALLVMKVRASAVNRRKVT